MSKKRIFALFAVLALMATAAVVGWAMGSRIQSPAEMALRTAAPTPSPIFAPVEMRQLSSKIVTRGLARFGLPQPVAIAPSTLKPKPGLITTLPLRNTQLQEGSVMLTASGRPVLVVQGKEPAYRDLVPGISGKDVRQLEESLKRLGYDPGELDGVYDKQTSAAVEKWYASGDWTPFGPTVDQIANLRTLEKNVADAKKAHLQAIDAAASADRAVASAHAAAQHNKKTSAADIEAKSILQDKAVSALANAKRAIQAARATAEHNKKVAAAEVARLVAHDTRLAAQSARAEAQHNNQVAAANIATKISDRALVVLDPRSSVTAREAADAQLEMARAAYAAAQLKGELAVRAADREVSAASQRLQAARAAVKAAELDGETAIQTAIAAETAGDRELKLAKQQLVLAQEAAKATQTNDEAAIKTALGAQRLAKLDIELAEKQLNQLTADLDTARQKAGIQIPVDEIIFLPDLPVRVENVTAVVGDVASGPVMSVTDFELLIEAALPIDVEGLVTPGMPVEIDERNFGIKAAGAVKMKAATPGTRGVDNYHVYFEVRVDPQVQQTGPALEGRSLRLTIPTRSTAGEVLVVPNNALSLAADGTSRVQVNTDQGLQYVAVKPGMAAEGYVEVTPVDGELAPGQEVVIGYEQRE